jgi:hypothetical protein
LRAWLGRIVIDSGHDPRGQQQQLAEARVDCKRPMSLW